MRHDLADLEPAVRTALVEWSIGSPRIDAMINATQAFATHAFSVPKVPPQAENLQASQLFDRHLTSLVSLCAAV